MRTKMMRVFGLVGVMAFLFTLNAAAQTKEEAAKLYNDGVAAFNAKNYPAAIAAFNQAIDVAEKVGDAANDVKDGVVKLLPASYLQNAIALYTGKKIEESVAEFNKTIEVGNKYNDQNVVNKAKGIVPQLYRLIGNQAFGANNFEKAKEYYNMGLKLTPDATQNLLGLGLVYEKQAKADSALVYFEKVIEVGTRTNKPEDVKNAKAQARDLFIEKAAADEKAKKYEDAIEAYKNVFKYAPESEAIYYKMAFDYYSISKWDEAIENSNKALGLITTPEDKGKVYFLLGNIYSKKNDNANACANYKLAAATVKYKVQATAALKGLKCK
jgi:Putative Zn-dependent protease, contains TPR repeats